MSNLSNELASLRIARDQRAPKRGKLLRVALIVLGCGGVAMAGWLGYPRVQAALLMPEVEVGAISAVSPTEASTVLTTSGYVVAKSSSKIGARLPGRVAKSLVAEGDKVEQGQVLFELDADTEQSAANAASMGIAVARAHAAAIQAEIDQLEKQIERQRVLVEKQVKGRATLEDLEARAEALKRKHDAALAESKAKAMDAQTQRLKLDDTKVAAPMAGTIVSPVPRVGELVGPSGPVVEIVDFGSLLVETDVPEARLHMLKRGSPCEIVLEAYPNERHPCKVLEIGLRVDRAKATVPARVEFTGSTENVLPNMSARVSFLSDTTAPAADAKPKLRPVVPQAALTERDGKPAVFVVKEGRIELQTVEVGDPVAEGRELLTGPPPGTRVVLNPTAELHDGQQVRQKEQ